MTKGKPVSIWMSEEEIKIIKDKSKADNRSLSNFIKCRIFENDKYKS